ncbi:DNA repair protein RecO [Desulfobulbus propionicus]|jgi:DNA repair protein RecO (recombination protein O)
MRREFPQQTRGFVIDVAEYAESDKLVTLYSRNHGRITAIAKGALKSKRRFVNKLEPYTFLLLFYQPPRSGSGLYLIKKAELLDAHLAIRLEYRRYVAATHFGELVLRFTREHDPDPALYTLIHWTLHALSTTAFPFKISVFSYIKLLTLLGYQPELTVCGQCRQVVHAERTYTLHPGSGSLLCPICHSRSSQTPLPQLSVQTVRVLARAQSTPLDRLQRLHLSARNISEALEALHIYAVALLQQDIHSWRTLRSLNTGG